MSPGFFSFPKKTDLKVGESSAFFTYVKSNVATSCNRNIRANHNSAPSGLMNVEDHHVKENTEKYNNCWQQESYFHGSVFVNNGETTCNMSTFQMPLKFPVISLSPSNTQPHSKTDGQNDVSGMQPVFPLPIYFPGMMYPNMMPSSVQMFQGDLNDVKVNNKQTVFPQFVPQFPYAPVMPSFSHHPAGINMQSGYMPGTNPDSSMTGSSPNEAKTGQTERRAAALIKFRQKRKDRCFNKKIRYINRKRLADTRPRVRGQFVRKANGVDVHLNDSAVDCDFEEEDEELLSRELELDSSPEHNAFES